MSRQFLFIILTILQIIAPLVHAHTNHGFVNSGLHVPGLESYEAGQSNVMLSAPNHSDADGLLVVVDTGFRQSQAGSLDYTNGDFILPVQPSIVRPTLFAFDANFSPHYPEFLSRLSFSLQAPRAPPSTN